MNIFLLLVIAMGISIGLIRKKIPVGISLIAGGLFMWAIRSLDPVIFGTSLNNMMHMTRTYDLMLSMYFVLCMEIQLRTSGALSDMVSALQKIFTTGKATIMVMPAFLGLLPSAGGARFSAPIVDEACRDMEVSQQRKAEINFWFRHPFEYSNPIIPGMIMACSITGLSYPDFAVHIAWVSIIAILVGYFILIRPLKYKEGFDLESALAAEEGRIRDVVLAISPIFITLLMVVLFDTLVSVALGFSVLGLYIVLKKMGRQASLKEIIIGALDKKLLVNVFCILYFIQLLTETKILDEIIIAFQAAPLPIPVIIAGISVIVGILTGLSQAHVAIVMPIVAAIMPGNLELAALAMVFGVAGQMITPTHLCLTVTTDYFKANLLSVIGTIVYMEIILLAVFSAVTYLIY